jgi:hypothetical protein
LLLGSYIIVRVAEVECLGDSPGSSTLSVTTSH